MKMQLPPTPIVKHTPLYMTLPQENALQIGLIRSSRNWDSNIVFLVDSDITFLVDSDIAFLVDSDIAFLWTAT